MDDSLIEAYPIIYLSFSFFLLLLAKGSKSIWQPWVPIHFSPSINSWGSKNDLASPILGVEITDALSLCSVGDRIQGFGHARHFTSPTQKESVCCRWVWDGQSEAHTCSSHPPPEPFILQQLHHHASCKLRHSVPCQRRSWVLSGTGRPLR